MSSGSPLFSQPSLSSLFTRFSYIPGLGSLSSVYPVAPSTDFLMSNLMLLNLDFFSSLPCLRKPTQSQSTKTSSSISCLKQFGERHQSFLALWHAKATLSPPHKGACKVDAVSAYTAHLRPKKQHFQQMDSDWHHFILPLASRYEHTLRICTGPRVAFRVIFSSLPFLCVCARVCQAHTEARTQCWVSFSIIVLYLILRTRSSVGPRTPCPGVSGAHTLGFYTHCWVLTQALLHTEPSFWPFFF